MKKVFKRKRVEEDGGEEVGEKLLEAPTEPLKTQTLTTKKKAKDDRVINKVAGHVSHKCKDRSSLKDLWGCDFVVDGWYVDEEDSVMKNKNGHGGLVADVVKKALLLSKDMKS